MNLKFYGSGASPAESSFASQRSRSQFSKTSYWVTPEVILSESLTDLRFQVSHGVQNLFQILSIKRRQKYRESSSVMNGTSPKSQNNGIEWEFREIGAWSEAWWMSATIGMSGESSRGRHSRAGLSGLDTIPLRRTTLHQINAGMTHDLIAFTH